MKYSPPHSFIFFPPESKNNWISGPYSDKIFLIKSNPPPERNEIIMSIRIGIIGYGNLGRGVECAIRQNPDM